MISLSEFNFLLYAFITIFLLIKPTSCIQSYDQSGCTAVAQVPGSNYLCNPKKSKCSTFLIYRAQVNQTLSSISSLFNMNESDIGLHNPPDHYQDPNFLYPGREIIIPVDCLCVGRFSQATFFYNNSNSYSVSRIACEIYEGLLKSHILEDENLTPQNGTLVRVPVRCACPEVNNGTRFLVTYPVQEHDNSHLIASTFGVEEYTIFDVNGLSPYQTIFPQTTLLIPTRDAPVINSSARSSIPPSPQQVIPLNKIVPGRNLLNHDLALLAGITLATMALVVLSCGVFICIRRRYHPQRFQPLSNKKLQSPPFSPDFLDGMSKLKHSLVSFSLDELRLATEDFSKGSLIGKAVYRGRIVSSCLAIEAMTSMESARHVVYILTKINHLNVVKLEGCCYGAKSYLVFEFAENGSVRDCLENPRIRTQLTWAKRLQIACDLAEGLHYIHYCTKPTYVHRNINSRNVLITKDWRAKISGFKLARPVNSDKEKGDSSCWNESVIVGNKGYLAPEYLDHGQASTKVDVYAFGVVLLELLSAKEVITEGKWLRDSIGFLAVVGGEDSTSCLEKFKGFMDPSLEGNYPMGDAISLALLAKGCTEENPTHRPTMNDLLKALSRIK